MEFSLEFVHADGRWNLYPNLQQHADPNAWRSFSNPSMAVDASASRQPGYWIYPSCPG